MKQPGWETHLICTITLPLLTLNFTGTLLLKALRETPASL